MSKFCSKCGKELKEGSNFCLYCGNNVNEKSETAVSTATVVSTTNNVKYNGLAIAGFVVALCSLILNFGGIVGAVGVILSSIGLSQCKKRGEKGFGLALAGTIVGGISVLYGIYTIAVFVNVVDFTELFDYFY